MPWRKRPTPPRLSPMAKSTSALATLYTALQKESIPPMPIEPDRSKVTVEELVTRIRSEMVPLGTIFSYFLVTPIAEEDLKPYLEDPIAALPPRISAALPTV